MRLRDIIPKCFGSAFQQDAAFTKKWTGADLSEEQFNTYKNNSTLKKNFGSKKDIHSSYYGYGIPAGFSASDIMVDILNNLETKGVIFDIEDEQQKELFEKLTKSVRLHLTQDKWPCIPNAYKTSAVLNEAVQNIRGDMKLPHVENALS